MNKQDFELNTLTEIFGNGDRCFVIPEYQRGYSWEKPQWTDLTKDITYLLESHRSYRHYTGTIVATKIDKESNSLPTYEVVDGQQRLTSLTLLISCLLQKLNAPNIALNKLHLDPVIIKENFLYTGENTGNTIRKFKVGSEQDTLYYSLIKEGYYSDAKLDTKSDQNLVNAYNYFSEWLADMPFIEVLDIIINRFGFLFYAPEKTKEIGIMFEVINNRGKQLSELEKLKNYLIYFADKNDVQDLRKTVMSNWGDILTRLNQCGLTSNEEENSFLRNCWIASQDTNKTKSYHVYEELKDKYPPDNRESWKELKSFVEFIDFASTVYLKFYTRETVTDNTEKEWLKRIHYHPSTASIMPLILAVYYKTDQQDILINQLSLLEKLNFRYYGAGIANRSDTGQGTLFGLAHKYVNQYGEFDENENLIDHNWLTKRLKRFIENRANDSSFVQHLTLDKDESGDYYSWPGLRFFLASYEEYLRSKDKESGWIVDHLMQERKSEHPNDYYHREHIWATKHYDVINDEEHKNVNKKRLGNFVLLKETENIKVSNKPPQVKAKLYTIDHHKEPNTLMIREIKDFFDRAQKFIKTEKGRQRKTYKYWLELYKKAFDLREEKLVNFALKRWHVKGIKENAVKVTINSFTDQNEIYKLHH